MGPAADDTQLLERYARSRDAAAFGELVRQRLDLVYSAAVRRVGDRHLAEDVTQAVFVILANRPDAARSSSSLGGWLLTTVRYAAANSLKAERRRRRHERSAAQAAAAGACSANPTDVLIWQELAAHLDDAVLRLPATDRRAVILRYFEERPIRDVAAALDVTEAAAKQRLSRSVDKLRRLLMRRAGTITLTPAGAAGLTTMLAAHAVRAAPAGLFNPASAAGTAAVVAPGGAVVAGGVGTSSASLAIAKGAMTMMTWAKVKAVAAGIAAAAVLGTGGVVTLNRAMAQRDDSAGAGSGAAVQVAARAAEGEDADKDKPKPEDAAIRKALEKELPEVVFDGVGLSDVVSFLMDVTSVPIILDRPALIAAEIDPATAQVSANLKKVTLEEALATVAAAAGTKKDPLAFDVVGDVIVISTEQGARDFVERHRAALAREDEPGGKLLTRRLPEVTFDKVALSDVVGFMRAVTGSEIEVDWAGLKEAGIERNRPISVRARNVKFSQALQLILDDLAGKKRIDFSLNGGRIGIAPATPNDKPPKRDGR